MAVDFLVLTLALAILLGGGEALVRGSSALARRLGVSSLVIGLTVVAFGTSAPELAVSLSAAVAGTSEIAFGNVVGSNIANVALLLGLTALLTPLAVNSELVTREIPMMILASASLAAVCLDSHLDGTPASVIARSDAVGLLLVFCVFLYYTVAGNLAGRGGDPLLDEARGEGAGTPIALPVAGLLTLAGLAGLALGGHLMVESATAIARALGIREVVIGVTIVAVGTSLPELVTCLAAARRGEADMAVGNIVGSNIFNALFVMGTSAVVRPVEVAPGGELDLAVMGALALVLLPMAMTGRKITRGEGAVLVLAYAGYVLWQLSR